MEGASSRTDNKTLDDSQPKRTHNAQKSVVPEKTQWSDSDSQSEKSSDDDCDDSGLDQEVEGAAHTADDHSEHKQNRACTEPSTTKAGRLKGGRRQKITEGVLQRMARHIVDNRAGWDDLSLCTRWEEFASRPEVRCLRRQYVLVCRRADANCYRISVER